MIIVSIICYSLYFSSGRFIAHQSKCNHYPVSNDFYRQALELDLRSKREFTSEVLSAMGGINKGYFRYLKALLQLSDEAIDLADQHNISEKHLRFIVQLLPPEVHLEVVRQIINYNLTSKQVKELIQQEWSSLDEKTKEEQPNIPRRYVQLANRLSSIKQEEEGDRFLATALLQQSGHVQLALTHLRLLRQLLESTEKRLLEAGKGSPG